MKPLKSLFIYNLIPDETIYYEVDQDDPIIELLKICHGICINGDKITEEQAVAYDKLDGENSLLKDKERIDESLLSDKVFQGVYVITFLQ